MSLSERVYAVWLGRSLVGHLYQRGDHTRFTFTEEYLADPDRPVLGLLFEQDLRRIHSAALRLPPWFSNLLPEGVLRTWIAQDRGVSVEREMELLAQVGHDLPGAVQVLPADGPPPAWPQPSQEPLPIAGAARETGWRFSLAGVQLKFSMLRRDDRLTLPAAGEGGDWIVKLPDRQYPAVPRNEFVMMSLAGAAGIEVPELMLVHRDDVTGLPAGIWPEHEEWAYAVRRFDRLPDRRPVHIEDLAQVRNFYPGQKYAGNYETIAGLIYRRHDLGALEQFARRLAFMVLVGNGDAHLKNWSLIYRDPRRPTLSPAYDLVATAPYGASGSEEDMGLKFFNSRRFRHMHVGLFDRLADRLRAADAHLADQAADTVNRAMEQWPRFEEHLSDSARLRQAIVDGMAERVKTLLSGGNG